MVFIQDIVRGTELTIASGGPPGGLPAATADPRQTPSPAARLAQARQKIGGLDHQGGCPRARALEWEGWISHRWLFGTRILSSPCAGAWVA